MESSIIISSHNGEYFKMLSHVWSVFKKNPTIYVGLALASTLLMFIPIISILSFFLSLGFINCFFKTMKNEKINFKDMVIVFKDLSFFLNFLVAMILVIIMTTIGYLLLLIPGIYISVVLFFSSILMITENKIGIDALKSSKEIVAGHWWEVFFFICFLIMINIAGALCLLVGLIITIPLTYLLIIEYCLYLSSLKKDIIILK